MGTEIKFCRGLAPGQCFVNAIVSVCLHLSEPHRYWRPFPLRLTRLKQSLGEALPLDTGTCAMPQRCEGEAGMIWDPDLKVAMSFSSIHPAVFAVSLLCAGDGQHMWFNSCPPRSCGVVGKEGVGVNKLRLQTDRWAKEGEGNLGDLLQSY